MKRIKKPNLTLNELQIESFITNLDQEKNLITGKPKGDPGHSNHCWTDPDWSTCGKQCPKSKEIIETIVEAASDAFSPFCWSYWESLVHGGIPFYC